MALNWSGSDVPYWMSGPEGVQVEDLGKRYGNKTALEGVSFTLPPGEMLALVGPDGAFGCLRPSGASWLYSVPYSSAPECVQQERRGRAPIRPTIAPVHRTTSLTHSSGSSRPFAEVVPSPLQRLHLPPCNPSTSASFVCTPYAVDSVEGTSGN